MGSDNDSFDYVGTFVPMTANLYDCYIKCDVSTQLLFRGLDQTGVLKLMQLVRDAVIYKDYTKPEYRKVSLMVETHEEADGNDNE